METKKLFQPVGTAKEDTKEKGRLFLKIQIPFFPKTELSAIPNSSKSEESHPDFLLFHEGNKAGSLFQNEDKSGNKYFSGKVFCLASPTNFLSLFIFKNEQKNEWEIKIPYQIEK